MDHNSDPHDQTQKSPRREHCSVLKEIQNRVTKKIVQLWKTWQLPAVILYLVQNQLKKDNVVYYWFFWFYNIQQRGIALLRAVTHKILYNNCINVDRQDIATMAKKRIVENFQAYFR